MAWYSLCCRRPQALQDACPISTVQGASWPCSGTTERDEERESGCGCCDQRRRGDLGQKFGCRRTFLPNPQTGQILAGRKLRCTGGAETAGHERRVDGWRGEQIVVDHRHRIPQFSVQQETRFPGARESQGAAHALFLARCERIDGSRDTYLYAGEVRGKRE